MLKWVGRLLRSARSSPQIVWHRCWIPVDGWCLVNRDSQVPFLEKGLYRRPDGIVVCFTCLGNCGQCGMRLGVDVKPSFSAITVSLNAVEKRFPCELVVKKINGGRG